MPNRPNSLAVGRLSRLVPYFLVTGFVVYICAFKLVDMDFWWHVKAGQIMLQTHQLIHTDPFTYSHSGMPYHSTHEWLSQILFYLVYHLSGATGIILLRTAIAAITFLIIVSIDRESLWMNSLLVIWAAHASRPFLLERPQLFTYLILALFLWLAYRYMEDERTGPEKRWILGAFVVLEILWVNLHGAACVLGGVVVLALLVHEFSKGKNIKPLAWTLAALAVGLLFSPNTYHSLTYFYRLIVQSPSAMVSEWQPRPWPLYWREMGPFWAAALLAAIFGRTRLFSAFLLAITGFLSMRAFRHEMLFIVVSTSAFIFEMKQWSSYQGALRWLASRPKLAWPLYATALVSLGLYSRVRYAGFARADYLYGYGVFEPARGAADFLDRENVQGNMFNADGIGPYLEYRGIPGRRVFVDSRNADYDPNFLLRVYFAGKDPDLWKLLDDEYHFSYAVIDYGVDASRWDYLRYCVHLEKNPLWKLVYLDDWIAVYLKDSPENRPLIERRPYIVVRPGVLDDRGWVWSLPEAQLPEARLELERSVAGNAEGIKTRISLARLLLRLQDVQGAYRLADEIVSHRPLEPESHEIMAAVQVQEGHWAEAGREYEEMIRQAGPNYPNVNYGFIADVYAKAGDTQKSLYYATKAGRPAS